MEKISVFIKIRVLFWPEISALGVLFNFVNERMHPPKYQSAPPPGSLDTEHFHTSAYVCVERPISVNRTTRSQGMGDEQFINY